MNNCKLEIYNGNELVSEFNDASYINCLLVDKLKAKFVYKSPNITKFKRENLFWCEQITFWFSNGFKEVYKLNIC